MQKGISNFALKKNMSENKNTGNMLARFFRYIRDELSGRERNSFERELQKDPFSEEALDGFANISESDATEDLKGLNENIRKRTTRKSRSALYRIAGIVVLMVSVSAVLVLTVVRKPANQVALNSPAPQTFEIRKSQPIIESDSREDITDDHVRKENKSFNSDESNTERAVEKTDSIESSEKMIEENAVTGSRAKASKEEASGKLAVSAPMTAMARRKSDTGHTASTGAQVETKSDTSVSFLSEVVVTGYGVKKSETRDEELSEHIYPQPVTGKSKFNEYVRTNLRRPGNKDSDKKAIVVLNFIVRTSGDIDSIRIIRSPGKEYSEEAIRVIKSGPLWNPAKENGKPVEEDVRLRIVFR